MTLNNFINIAEKEYGLKKLDFISQPRSFGGGRCYYTEGYVIINKRVNKTKEQIIRALFHELGHIYCYNNNIWSNYHYSKYFNELTHEEKKKIIKIGLRAEKWVDDWAEKEIKKYFPNINYIKKYYNKENLGWYHENYLNKFKN